MHPALPRAVALVTLLQFEPLAAAQESTDTLTAPSAPSTDPTGSWSGEGVLHQMEVADPNGRTIALRIFARDLADPATAVKKFCDLQSGHGRRGPTVGAWEAWAVDDCARDIMRNLAPTLDRLRGVPTEFPMAGTDQTKEHTADAACRERMERAFFHGFNHKPLSRLALFKDRFSPSSFRFLCDLNITQPEYSSNGACPGVEAFVAAPHGRCEQLRRAVWIKNDGGDIKAPMYLAQKVELMCQPTLIHAHPRTDPELASMKWPADFTVLRNHIVGRYSAMDEMTVASCAGDLDMDFQNMPFEEYSLEQATKALDHGLKVEQHSIEVHLIDSLSRALFFLRMPDTVAWMESLRPGGDRAAQAFHFGYFNVIGYSTKGNLPTLWQGCRPEEELFGGNLEQAGSTVFRECERALGAVFEEHGYIVTVMTNSNGQYSLPIRPTSPGAAALLRQQKRRLTDEWSTTSADLTFLDLCSDAAHCIEPWYWPHNVAEAAENKMQKKLRGDWFGWTQTGSVHLKMLSYMDQLHDNYKWQPRFIWFHSLHGKQRQNHGNGDHGDSSAELPLIDADVQRYLAGRMRAEPVLIWLLADHGQTVGTYAESSLGIVEQDSPIAVLLASEGLLDADGRANLEWNQDMLVSMADVYATIVASTRLFFANSSASFTPSRGADLTAVRLPSDRTCADAHIPAYACPAQKSGGERMAPCDLAPDDLASVAAALADALNRATARHTDLCEPVADISFEHLCMRPEADRAGRDRHLELQLRKNSVRWIARAIIWQRGGVEVTMMIRTSKYADTPCFHGLAARNAGELVQHYCVCREAGGGSNIGAPDNGGGILRS